MRVKLLLIIFLSFFCLCGQSALAIDHSSPDEGRPLKLQGPYPIAHREYSIQMGGGYFDRQRESDHFFLPLQIKYGAAPNFQAELGTRFFTDPRDLNDPNSGDLNLSGLYNFNQETLSLPAISVKASAKFPTGVGSRGVDFEAMGIVTKSIERLSLHGNAALEYLTGSRENERDTRYRFVFGPSYPIAAPMYTRTTLLADIFIEQSHQRGQSETIGVEAGFRNQLTETVVLDAGLGTEVSGPSLERRPFFLSAGFSISF